MSRGAGRCHGRFLPLGRAVVLIRKPTRQAIGRMPVPANANRTARRATVKNAASQTQPLPTAGSAGRL
jgi:hypothetical protein